MIKVKMKGTEKRKKILPLVMALANKIIRDLGIEEGINNLVKWDQSRSNVSPGGLMKAVILSTFTDLRAPLTHIQRRFAEVDTEYLFGENVANENINAFNIGRMLDQVSEIDYNGFYETTALTAIQMNEVTVERLHADTTTISFYGEYDIDEMDLSEEEQEELLKIERGYNKDGRPLCNQVVVGQIVNEVGIPIISRVQDGSTSDVEWNRNALQYLQSIAESGFSNGIFVADSKLMIEDIVKAMTNPEKPIRFVSRCPANFENKLESRMIRRAYAEDHWEEIGQYQDGKNASHYKGISFVETVFGRPMRLLVCQSSTLVDNALKALEKAKEKLKPLIRETEKKSFACFADAERERERFLAQKELKMFDCDIGIEKEVVEKWSKGRRGKDTKPKILENYHIIISKVDYIEERKIQFLQNESCVVIASNVLDDTDNRTLLGIYKGQQVVENSFRLLKEPSIASVIYLKNTNRIQALSMILTMALLIRAIIQYRMRDGLKKFREENPNEKLKVGWQGKPLENPTYKLFYEHSINCFFEKESPQEYSFSWGGKKTEYQVSTLLNLMGYQLEELLE